MNRLELGGCVSASLKCLCVGAHLRFCHHLVALRDLKNRAGGNMVQKKMSLGCGGSARASLGLENLLIKPWPKHGAGRWRLAVENEGWQCVHNNMRVLVGRLQKEKKSLVVQSLWNLDDQENCVAKIQKIAWLECGFFTCICEVSPEH